MKKNPKIIAVVVSYNPEKTGIENNLLAVLEQVDSVILVDNSDNKNVDLSYLRSANLDLISLGENMGIAYAQNIGIESAISQGAEYVLLLDQDSRPTEGMVETLLSRSISLGDGGDKIGAVAPICVDPRTGIKSYFLVTRYGFPYRYNPERRSRSDTLITAGFLISSGSLISVEVLRGVGGKRSNYFIDHVDTEWCFRARLKKYLLVGVHDAVLEHSIGDSVKRFWLFYFRNIPYHSPLRDYYMFRNSIFTIRDIKGHNIWRFLLVYRLVQFMVYFLTFTSERKFRFKAMLMGILHGIRGVDGKLNLDTWDTTSIPKTSLDP